MIETGESEAREAKVSDAPYSITLNFFFDGRRYVVVMTWWQALAHARMTVGVVLWSMWQSFWKLGGVAIKPRCLRMEK